MEGRVIIVFGAPSAGKGTQAERLSRELSLPHVSTGDLLRDNIARRTPLGTQATEFLEAGRLVPDGLVVDMVFDRVARPDCDQGFLLDGFPRTLGQVESLDAHLGGGSTVTVLCLEVPDEVLVERATSRLICETCGRIHQRPASSPTSSSGSSSGPEGRCEACQGKLQRRPDDEPEVVRKRLAVYHDQTRPVADHYRKRGLLCEVDGNQAPDSVFEACLACLGEER